MEKEKKQYTTDELKRAFIVHGFCAPFVVVTKKDTGEKGTLQFNHRPRIYFDFIADK